VPLARGRKYKWRKFPEGMEGEVGNKMETGSITTNRNVKYIYLFCLVYEK